MKKLIILSVVSASVLFSSVEAGARKQRPGLEYKYTEVLEVDLPTQGGKQWKCAYNEVSNDGESIIEYIPKNENMKNRTELVTVQFFAHSPRRNTPPSAIDFVNFLYEQIAEVGYDMKWNIIKQSDNDVLVEWILPKGHKNLPPQYEIARIIWTEKGIHRIAYEKKARELDPQSKELWLNVIESAKLIHTN